MERSKNGNHKKQDLSRYRQSNGRTVGVKKEINEGTGVICGDTQYRESF